MVLHGPVIEHPARIAEERMEGKEFWFQCVYCYQSYMLNTPRDPILQYQTQNPCAYCCCQSYMLITTRDPILTQNPYALCCYQSNMLNTTRDPIMQYNSQPLCPVLLPILYAHHHSRSYNAVLTHNPMSCGAIVVTTKDLAENEELSDKSPICRQCVSEKKPVASRKRKHHAK